MKNKKYKIIACLIAALFLFHPLISLGQEAEVDDPQIKEINQEIQTKRDRIKKMQEQQDLYNKALEQKQKEKATLNNQLAILENRLAKAALDIDSARTEIDRTNLEIEKVIIEINDKDKQIARQKGHIASVVRLMQQQDGKSALEAILLNDTLNEFISQAKYLSDINKEISHSLEAITRYKKDLEEKQKNLNDSKKALTDLKVKLEDKKVKLASEEQSKAYLLERTKSSEKEYQRMLKLAKEEQQKAEADIVNLEKEERARILKISGKELEFNDAGFIWPVAKNTVVAFFHDPDYPFRYVFEHPAVDVRAAQGTIIRAAASGYIAIAKDAGTGYSYIMIIHGNSLATVYGHVSKIYVQADEYVVQGQAIGLSGGTPGTRGAGRMTTGPHLHFEVRLNGVPVDPMEYLP
ncbi:MAG: peptidoglycan DD-metalloendopeptidase family protein [Patescibacteria group bacterium]|nr:peptidoglycan DD-metalloendopeptidase family protein [Patescibacteria group bacterium]